MFIPPLPSPEIPLATKRKGILDANEQKDTPVTRRSPEKQTIGALPIQSEARAYIGAAIAAHNRYALPRYGAKAVSSRSVAIAGPIAAVIVTTI